MRQTKPWRKVSSAATIHAVVRLAEADPAVTIDAEVFDADIWLLNTHSGIVDLRNGQLHPHRRDKLMTRICGAAPIAAGTAGGDCPVWQQFLHDVTGKDPAFENYLQRVAGYLLTGSIGEHAIFFLYGPGGTGKSTFKKVLEWVMGDYATTAAMDLFTVEVGSRHDTELAALHGRRLVLAGEVDAGKRWNEAKLKAISGGDEISARFIRGNPFTFTPQFKLVMAGNNRPHMWNGGDAMRRRMNLIPFLFKPAIVDKELDAKLRRELPGILAWMIEGEVKRRLLGGLNPPTVIRNATDEYFADEDLIGRWIEERCVCQPAARSPVRTLYADLQSWAAMVGERWVPSLKVFSQRLALQRFKATRSGSRHDFLGIALCGGEERLAGLDDPMSDPAEDWPRE